ncbi:IS5 family transposase [Schlesneria paludicola]|uniref:IS5 family transposase n=2 Tax=Planctomycetia TaxID=203683 RepID=UPI000310A328|nr:IS5 family transposase [Schlesneria paludicola]
MVRTPARIAGAWQNRLVGGCGGRLVRTSQKGGDGVGKTKCGKGTKIVDVVDSNGTPLAVHLTSANHNEVKLIEPTLDRLQIPHQVPEHLIYDRAADSDPLRNRLLNERGIELVCPHRKSRKKPPTQDGRACRRYRRRFVVERTHSWFHNFRRTVVRYETTLARFTGWIHLACALITMRRL